MLGLSRAKHNILYIFIRTHGDRKGCTRKLQFALGNRFQAVVPAGLCRNCSVAPLGLVYFPSYPRLTSLRLRSGQAVGCTFWHRFAAERTHSFRFSEALRVVTQTHRARVSSASVIRSKWRAQCRQRQHKRTSYCGISVTLVRTGWMFAWNVEANTLRVNSTNMVQIRSRKSGVRSRVVQDVLCWASMSLFSTTWVVIGSDVPRILFRESY